MRRETSPSKSRGILVRGKESGRPSGGLSISRRQRGATELVPRKREPQQYQEPGAVRIDPHGGANRIGDRTVAWSL